MVKEITTKVVTPETERKTLQSFSFPVEGITIEAETLEEAKEILAKKLLIITNKK
jgi:hypothetical protein